MWYSLHLDKACILMLFILLKEPSLKNFSAGDWHHGTVNRGELGQGTGGATAGEQAGKVRPWGSSAQTLLSREELLALCVCMVLCLG